ncbi:uncharacterized protein ACOB8E_009950 [Sarcophilus harrisii]
MSSRPSRGAPKGLGCQDLGLQGPGIFEGKLREGSAGAGPRSRRQTEREGRLWGPASRCCAPDRPWPGSAALARAWVPPAPLTDRMRHSPGGEEERGTVPEEPSASSPTPPAAAPGSPPAPVPRPSYSPPPHLSSLRLSGLAGGRRSGLSPRSRAAAATAAVGTSSKLGAELRPFRSWLRLQPPPGPSSPDRRSPRPITEREAKPGAANPERGRGYGARAAGRAASGRRCGCTEPGRLLPTDLCSQVFQTPLGRVGFDPIAFEAQRGQAMLPASSSLVWEEVGARTELSRPLGESSFIRRVLMNHLSERGCCCALSALLPELTGPLCAEMIGGQCGRRPARWGSP